MDYKPIKNAVTYLKKLYNKADDIAQKVTSILPSGLELAVVGMPKVPNKNLYDSDLPITNYYFAHGNIKNYNTEPDGRVKVTRNDGKTIMLDPKSVQNSEEGYVKKKLGDAGMSRASSAQIKKIAKALKQNH
jgi:hypothetical protein